MTIGLEGDEPGLARALAGVGRGTWPRLEWRTYAGIGRQKSGSLGLGHGFQVDTQPLLLLRRSSPILSPISWQYPSKSKRDSLSPLSCLALSFCPILLDGRRALPFYTLFGVAQYPGFYSMGRVQGDRICLLAPGARSLRRPF